MPSQNVRLSLAVLAFLLYTVCSTAFTTKQEERDFYAIDKHVQAVSWKKILSGAEDMCWTKQMKESPMM